jgi:Xaa-Pro dipeptidase
MSDRMNNPGTMALDEGGRVDFARMRRDRRERMLAAMERHGIDVLVLGRESNARYASGARRLSLAGTRPFGPGCVVVRATGQAHLISTWDDGIPPEIPHENLFGITWNPLNYVEWIKAMEGVSGAKRVGVDAMSPLFGQLLPLAVPGAELVAADELMFEARRTKTADEIACIRTAVAVAEASMSTAIAVLRPGVRERDLLGAFERQMADLGVTVPAREGTFCVTPRDQDPAKAAPNHNPRFFVDEGALTVGTRTMAALAVNFLSAEPK